MTDQSEQSSSVIASQAIGNKVPYCGVRLGPETFLHIGIVATSKPSVEYLTIRSIHFAAIMQVMNEFLNAPVVVIKSNDWNGVDSVGDKIAVGVSDDTEEDLLNEISTYSDLAHNVVNIPSINGYDYIRTLFMSHVATFNDPNVYMNIFNIAMRALRSYQYAQCEFHNDGDVGAYKGAGSGILVGYFAKNGLFSCPTGDRNRQRGCTCILNVWKLISEAYPKDDSLSETGFNDVLGFSSNARKV